MYAFGAASDVEAFEGNISSVENAEAAVEGVVAIDDDGWAEGISVGLAGAVDGDVGLHNHREVGGGRDGPGVGSGVEAGVGGGNIEGDGVRAGRGHTHL